MNPDEIDAHLRRLGHLKVQAAAFGIGTPPQIHIEIEDIQKKLENASLDKGELESRLLDTKSPQKDFTSAISLILIDLQNREYPLTKCLISALLLAARINDDSLEEFCYSNLLGLNKSDNIPDYRRVSGTLVTYPDTKNPINIIKRNKYSDCEALVTHSVFVIELCLRAYDIIDEVDILEMRPKRYERRVYLRRDEVISPDQDLDHTIAYVESKSYEKILDAIRADLVKHLINVLKVTKA